MNTTSEESVDLNKYELMLIFVSDLGEATIEKELEEIEKQIKSDGGDIFNKDIWGNRDLAYRIRKHGQGFYIVLNLNLPPSKISEFEKSLNINQAVIRFLLTRLPLNYTLRTFSEYQAEAEEAAKKAAEARKVKEEEKMAKKKNMPHARPKPVAEAPRVEKVEKVKAVPVEEKAEEKPVEEEEAPKKAKKVADKATEKSKLEEVDEKLKNIINDPDISL